MSSPLISFLLRLQGSRLIVLVSVAVLLAVQLIVAAMSFLLHGRVTGDFLLTGLVAAALVAPSSLWLIHSLLRELARAERDQLQNSIWHAESRLYTAVEAAQMLFWELDLVQRRLNYEDADLNYLGMATEGAAHDLQSWIATIHPDDRESFVQQFLASVEADGPDFDLEYRVVLRSGGWGWIHTRGKVVQRSAEGTALWAAGGSINVDRRKQVENDLRSTKQTYYSIFNTLTEAIYILDEAFTFIEVNAGAEKMYGYSHDELVGMTALDVAAPGLNRMNEITAQMTENARTGVQAAFEFWGVRKNGQIFPKSVIVTRGTFFDRTVLIATARDITEQKQIEMELLHNQNRLKDAQRIARVGSWELDLLTNTLAWSDEVFRLFEIDQTRFGATYEAFLNAIHPEDRAEVGDAYTRSLKTGAPYSITHRLLMPDGRIKYVEEQCTSYFSAEGVPIRSVGTVQDITERKVAEIALANSHNLLKSVIDTMPARVFWKDTELRYLGCNSIFSRDAGRSSPDELVGKDDFQMPWKNQAAQYRADDLQVMRSGIARLNYEEPQTTPDGHELWLRTSKVPLRDEGGEIVGILGLYEDITAQKTAAEKLRLSALVLENSSEAVLITDEQNRIVEINPAFTKLTGYTRDEVLGEDPALLRSGRHESAFYRGMWQEIDAHGFWQGEVWNRRKNGEIFAEWLTINTIRNPDGSVHRYVGLFSDITEKKKSEELIWTQANFDPLTRLPNRRMFNDRLAQDIKKAHRAGSKLALLFLDLDRFKEVNDSLGHDAGDGLLIEAAQRIASCVRESDTVARLGGDEFIVILSELGDRSSVERIATAILNALAQPFALGSEVAHVSASLGITLYPDDATTPGAILKNADQAMYAAKNSGRNRFSYFTSVMQEEALHRLRLLNDLHGALKAGELQLYYQPIVEISSGRIFKAEALLRWFHPKRGLINPAQFIPLAEESGLIHEIGDWVFGQAANQAREWASRYAADFQISVNKSPLQIQSQRECCKWRERMLSGKAQGRNLVIEITERLLLDNSPGVTAELLAFRDAGIQLAIDDFGTGYSALSYLKKLDIDYIKLDQSFICNLETDRSDKALSEAIVVMAHKLGLQVIAEGVETQAQLDLLAGMGCDFAQGFLYSRAIPAQEFEQLLLDNYFGNMER